MKGSKKKLLVCVKGKSCSRRDSVDIYRKLKKAINSCQLDDYYEVKKTDCFGFCKFAPIIAVAPDGCAYGRLRGKDIERVLKRHFSKKKPSRKLFVVNRKKDR